MAIQSFYVFKIKYKVIFKHRVFLSVVVFLGILSPGMENGIGAIQ